MADCSSSVLKGILFAFLILLIFYIYGYNKLVEYVKIKYNY